MNEEARNAPSEKPGCISRFLIARHLGPMIAVFHALRLPDLFSQAIAATPRQADRLVESDVGKVAFFVEIGGRKVTVHSTTSC